MGGLLWMRLTFSSPLSPNQLLTQMWPTTCTSFELPVRTSIEPEPVSTCKFTVPVTCSVRSKSPRAEATADTAQTAKKRAVNTILNRSEATVERMEPPLFRYKFKIPTLSQRPRQGWGTRGVVDSTLTAIRLGHPASAHSGLPSLRHLRSRC